MAGELNHPTWRNSNIAFMSDADLLEAQQFCERAYCELYNWAPLNVWAFFSTMLSDLTIEQARRMSKEKIAAYNAERDRKI